MPGVIFKKVLLLSHGSMCAASSANADVVNIGIKFRRPLNLKKKVVYTTGCNKT